MPAKPQTAKPPEKLHFISGLPRSGSMLLSAILKPDEFDARLGLPGLHSVKSKVSAPKRESVLPPDLFNRFAKDSFWLNPKNNIRKVPIIRRSRGSPTATAKSPPPTTPARQQSVRPRSHRAGARPR